MQDYVDELMADNAKVKQKYIFRKRRLQRQQSAPHFTTHDGRPHSGKRPSSAGRRSTIVPTLEFITEAPTVTGKCISNHGSTWYMEMDELLIHYAIIPICTFTFSDNPLLTTQIIPMASLYVYLRILPLTWEI